FKDQTFLFRRFFSAAIRLYHVHFRNASFIFYSFIKIIVPKLFTFETAVLLSAKIIYHISEQLSKHFFCYLLKSSF
ncbi:hypothetical protein ACIFQM_22930, partial [Paenibacillus sp. NRS-1782]|uniref:hypothetical protein n=1 Tax=Paenibacillus sp. NRS-1782 TaxID=3233906 RepID=UPI003D27AF1E